MSSIPSPVLHHHIRKRSLISKRRSTNHVLLIHHKSDISADETSRSVNSPHQHQIYEPVSPQAQAAAFGMYGSHHIPPQPPPGSSSSSSSSPSTVQQKSLKVRRYTAPTIKPSQKHEDDDDPGDSIAPPHTTNAIEKEINEESSPPQRSPRKELDRPSKYPRSRGGHVRSDTDEAVGPPSLNPVHSQMDSDTQAYQQQAKSDEDYYKNPESKQESFSNDNTADTRKDSNMTMAGSRNAMVEDDRQLAERQKLSNMDKQNMMDGIQVNIKRLEKSVHQLKKDLRDKNVDMDNLESVTNEMDLRELDLTRGLDNVRSVIKYQTQELDGKKERILDLKEQIAILQAELAHEESTLEPMERSILLLEQKALDREQKLLGHRAERKSFSVMKQNLVEERDSLNRELHNSHSELKSLKVMQDLALDDESFSEDFYE